MRHFYFFQDDLPEAVRNDLESYVCGDLSSQADRLIDKLLDIAEEKVRIN